MKIRETKCFIPKRFELGPTLDFDLVLWSMKYSKSSQLTLGPLQAPHFVPTRDDPILKRKVGHLKESLYLAHRISRTTKEDCLVSAATFFSQTRSMQWRI